MEAIDMCATKDEFIKFIESDIPDKKFFRIDEVAEYFGVKSQTVRLWVKWNKIECEKLGGSIRIHRQSIINFRLKGSSFAEE
jgi:excisionase family DNA binding protein